MVLLKRSIYCLILLAAVLLLPKAGLASDWSAQPQATTKIVLHKGEEQTINLAWVNNGSSTWASDTHPVKVATSGPRDRPSIFYSSKWLSSNRLAQISAPVAPSGMATFAVALKAPVKLGLFTEKLELVAEYLTWISNSQIVLTIEVIPDGPAYQIVNKSDNLKLVAGGQATLSVEVKNVGTTVWSNSGTSPIKLATSQPNDRKSAFRDASWLSANRVMLLPVTSVAPGETVKFEFQINAPLRSRIYKEEFNLVAEYAAWLPPQHIIWQIEVGPPVYKALLKGQAPDPVLKPGEQATLWVEFQNAGNVPWENTGHHPVCLGTSSRLDRTSVFQDASWISPNRPAVLKQSKIMPGEIGRFELTVKAPDKIGDYRENFRLVAEYLAWLDNSAVSFNIKVEQELVLQNPIRVGLTATTGPTTFSSNGTFVIRDGSGNLIARIVGGSAQITSNNSFTITANGQSKTVSGIVKVIPVNNSLIQVADDGVSSTYNTFRGILRLERSAISGRVWLNNDLELEDYLKGVAEMPSGWPLEALKAQAVLARTWALRARFGPVADIFDLYDDTRSQVYYGYNYEQINPTMTQAAQATAGLVIKYGGNYAATYYSADSGGYTESVENVWAGNPIPYLVAVPDPYAKPVTWQATLTQDFLAQRFDAEFRAAGITGQSISDMTIAQTDPSGRAKQIVFTASSGKTVTVSGIRFDYLVGSIVKSMLFTVSKDAATSAPNFILDGKGNGHGVGLSQWSAYNMANAGKKFDEIIKFFYLGVNIINE